MIAIVIVDEFSDQIGGKLTEARESAGLSVDDVIFRTRIPRGVVTALEAGDFTFFSSPTYAKSFLSQYSSFLEVDATRWLDALQPAYFIADEISPLLSSTDSHEIPVRNFGNSSNWSSTLVLFALSAGLVFAAVKVVEYLDARFSTESNPPADSKAAKAPVAPHSPTPPPVPKPGENVTASPQLPEEVVSEPPPRALIVR